MWQRFYHLKPGLTQLVNISTNIRHRYRYVNVFFSLSHPASSSLTGSIVESHSLSFDLVFEIIRSFIPLACLFRPEQMCFDVVNVYTLHCHKTIINLSLD